jgi:hypothetical protein
VQQTTSAAVESEIDVAECRHEIHGGLPKTESYCIVARSGLCDGEERQARGLTRERTWTVHEAGGMLQVGALQEQLARPGSVIVRRNQLLQEPRRCCW